MSHEPAEVPNPHVVFVHGLWMNGLETLCLRRRLQRLGFTPRVFHYRSMSAELARVVDDLSAQLAHLPPPVHLVGHSLGGLMLLRLFELRPGQPPGRVVLMGAPARGSQAARSVSRWTAGPALIFPPCPFNCCWPLIPSGRRCRRPSSAPTNRTEFYCG